MDSDEDREDENESEDGGDADDGDDAEAHTEGDDHDDGRVFFLRGKVSLRMMRMMMTVSMLRLIPKLMMTSMEMLLF